MIEGDIGSAAIRSAATARADAFPDDGSDLL
jgi:hypothetical protein